jgi:YrbI family 3-deoxy-D-manno-octulosonate 8-phosphate phosphatase
VTVVAIIPARGGSKRIPSKNLIEVAGHPLIEHTIRHALNASTVDEVYVSTEDEQVAAVAGRAGAAVIKRPLELAGDTASSETALLHALDVLRSGDGGEPELVVFLQCTSPVRRAGDIDAAVRTLLDADADSLFSAIENRDLLWRLAANGPEPVNYDPSDRRREQDMDPQVRENGSIYVFRPEVLRRDGHRLGGRTAVYEMDYWTSFQLDDPSHVTLLDWILRRREFRSPVAWPQLIALVVFDFDGVMTDNAVWVGEDGAEIVRCDRADGWGIARLREIGMPMLILSTETHPVVTARANKLAVPCLQGVADKAAALSDYLQAHRIDPDEVVFVGNDVNDLGCLELVGMPVAVADAHPAVAERAAHVLERRGGAGAVRELCELLLERAGAGAGAGAGAP